MLISLLSLEKGLSGVCGKAPENTKKNLKIPISEQLEWRHLFYRSEAWGPPPFQEKRSRSEKAIRGALGEFQGILGAALGIRNSILRMASNDLSNTKTAILGKTPGAIPGIDSNPHERFSFAPAFSECFFKNLGWSPRARIEAPQNLLRTKRIF